MRILFLHNNFPGQYRRIVNRLRDDKSFDLLSASLDTNVQPAPIERVGYRPHRAPREDIHPAARYTESTILTGQATLKALLDIKKRGWKPDIVLSHSGWGNGMFIKDAWPDTKVLSYFEWYYNADGGDSGFLDGKALDINARMRTRLKNNGMLQDLAAMDWGQCPTIYQRSQFPEIFHNHISVLHDGVDTEFFSPLEGATFAIGERVFRRGDPLVTYIARGMEPYRGFPQFIAAVARLQKINPDFHVAIIGADRVAYGSRRKDGLSWKDAALAEHKPDMARLHFMGNQPLNVLRDILRVSAVHVYLTVPFVLSWSMLEAMSCGALVLGSATPPVEEVIRDGENGYLTDFFDVKALAKRMQMILESPYAHESQRVAARKRIVSQYQLDKMTSLYLDLIHSVASGQRRAP